MSGGSLQLMEAAIYSVFLAVLLCEWRRTSFAEPRGRSGSLPCASASSVQIGRRIKLAMQKPTWLCRTNVSRG